jgi:HEAT repeat protein
VSDVVDRYRDALRSGDQATLLAWAATGAEGIELLRRELERPTIQPAIGYGRIDDPEATRRLVIALEADAWSTRIDAVMGLGRRADPRATAALIEALDDPEYVVRYHAFRSLTAIGDETALRILRRPAWPTAGETDLARAARNAIEARRAAR